MKRFRIGGHVYTFSQSMLVNGKNHHNVIKELSFNLNKLIKKTEKLMYSKEDVHKSKLSQTR